MADSNSKAMAKTYCGSAISPQQITRQSFFVIFHTQAIFKVNRLAEENLAFLKLGKSIAVVSPPPNFSLHHYYTTFCKYLYLSQFHYI
jgi:hypothetical protein